MKTVLFIVNDFSFFLSHRLPLATRLRNEGISVHLATTAYKNFDELQLTALEGINCHEIPLSRGGMNIFFEMKTFLSIFKVFIKVQPDLVHLVTIKPVLYGGIIARVLNIKGVVAAISGLGSMFTVSKFKFILPLIKLFYRIAFSSRGLKVIVQNKDDLNTISAFVNLNEEHFAIIRGSGVKLEDYTFSEEPEGEIVVSMAARLLKDKGVLEYIEAIRILRNKNVHARFRLIGDVDLHNPTSILPSQIEDWTREGGVELLGFRTDINSLFMQSHIVVLPSYREGLPKVLAEAAACGRAVVTTDVPGCRDAIESDLTGILVPPKNSEALALAIEELILNPVKRKKMGIAGRLLAEEVFDIQKIVNEHFSIYKELGLFNK